MATRARLALVTFWRRRNIRLCRVADILPISRSVEEASVCIWNNQASTDRFPQNRLSENAPPKMFSASSGPVALVRSTDDINRSTLSAIEDLDEQIFLVPEEHRGIGL